LRRDFAAIGFVFFEGLVLGVEAWLDIVDELYPQALNKVRTSLARAEDRMTQMIAPQMVSVHLVLAAIVLTGMDGGRRGRDAVRCLAAADRLLPPGHVQNPTEREARITAEAAARALLGDAEYEAAYAEGERLSLEEAVALV
ncbi:MAG: AfsR/SARP family transcriptional regulator, partial [Streptomyces sp.]|nr:AfsR/SARP family transcriptional regulator [Streptomyces sp.]